MQGSEYGGCLQLYFHELLPVFLLIQAVYRKQFCELSQGNPHERGKKLLTETDMKIIEISQAVGYDNEKHFMKIFKATCGVSPTEYRHNAYLSKS